MTRHYRKFNKNTITKIFVKRNKNKMIITYNELTNNLQIIIVMILDM